MILQRRNEVPVGHYSQLAFTRSRFDLLIHTRTSPASTPQCRLRASLIGFIHPKLYDCLSKSYSCELEVNTTTCKGHSRGYFGSRNNGNLQSHAYPIAFSGRRESSHEFYHPNIIESPYHYVEGA